MQPIYIESSDEITTVIERLKASKDQAVALVVPKGAILLQSIVNLKLARRAAVESGKELTLITTDKIGRNLANQLGISVFSRLDEQNIPENTQEDLETTDPEPSLVAGVKVHRYYEEEEKVDPALLANSTHSDVEAISSISTDSSENQDVVPEPIIPKELLSPAKEETSKNEEVVEAPIVIRPLKIEIPNSFPVKPLGSNSVVEIIPPSKNRKSIKLDKVEKKSKKPRWRRLFVFGIYLVILGLIVAAGFGAFYWPKTDVVLQVKAQPFEKTLQTTAKIDTTAAVATSDAIPATTQTYEITDSSDFAATGSADIGQKATGSAKLFNRNGRIIAIPAGTTLTSNDISFVTNDLVNIPSATVNPDSSVADPIIPGSVSVNITAQNAGSDSNLTNSRGSVGVYVSDVYCMIVSTTGGSSQKVAVITQTDLANAKQVLSKKIQTATETKLDELLKNQDLIFDKDKDQFSLQNTSFSQPAGTQVDKGTVTAKGVLKRLTAKKSDLDLSTNSRAMLDLSKDTENILNQTTTTKTVVDNSAQTITISTLSKGSQRQIIPLDNIKSQLMGKNKDQGISLIKLIVKDVQVKITQSPTWWPNQNFPYSSKYLTVKVENE